MQKLKLKQREDKRLLVGHLWIFSNEVDVAATPLSTFQPGETVLAESAAGRPLGVAHINPGALIAARILEKGVRKRPDGEWYAERLRRALDLRSAMYDEPFYRLVHGEGDGLPGLIVDRFDDVVVVQPGTSGMETDLNLVLQGLEQVLSPKAVVVRRDSSGRRMEGLEEREAEIIGDLPETILVREAGLQYVVNAIRGQKTGWYFDMRDIRVRAAGMAAKLCAGSHESDVVIDAFSYVGAFGVRAAKRGARRVIFIDTSQTALDAALENAAANDVADRVEVVKGDAFELLADLEKSSIGFISVDPPAFIKKKKDAAKGAKAYAMINRSAVRALRSGGMLSTSSCSQHFSPDKLRTALANALAKEHACGRILGAVRLGADHPANPAMPETEYLKAYLALVEKT